MKIDSHHHFWKYNEAEYSWISDPKIKRDFLISDLEKVLDTVGIDKAISVQARQSLEETEWLLAFAKGSSRIAGVVGWVDLRATNVEEKLSEYQKNKKFLGVRHVLQDEPDDKFMLAEDFQRGIEVVTRLGLVYDLLIYHRHLPVALDFCEKNPNTRIVLDHIAKPDIKNNGFEPWAKNIKSLAKFGNVFCKVSGIITEANWDNWTAVQIEPYLDAVFEAFGEDRLMYGSDWPVCLLAGEYLQVYSLIHDYVSKKCPQAMNKIFGENAFKAYQL